MGMSDFTGTQAGCARQKGDKIDHLRKELSRYVKGSRNHKKAKRVLFRESRRISNKQENDEWRIARSITAGRMPGNRGSQAPELCRNEGEGRKQKKA